MLKFNFEKNLAHQSKAVESTVNVFENLEIKKTNKTMEYFANPEILYKNDRTYKNNIAKIQEANKIKQKIKENSNVIDIMMETGTGKTYTYTKTIFELNKKYGIYKFIIVVPSLSIKAGTINFLKSDACREHFLEQYNKKIKLHIVQSKQNSKKNYFPNAVNSFIHSQSCEKNYIQVMIINNGMLNSKTMIKQSDKTFFDQCNTPFEAISITKPFVIIDEPHKFKKENTSWTNILNFNPQFILRYGATFPEEKKTNETIKKYHNLVYILNAIESFNKNLVKGVIGHITEFDAGKNIYVKFLNSDKNEASFQLEEEGKNKKTFKLIKNDSMARIHPEMKNIEIENFKKDEIILSNGLILKKGDKINPYCYNHTLQTTMIEKAIEEHFKLERELLERESKIKPLTLFFIENINEYRNKDGYIKKIIEERIKYEAEKILKEENISEYYKNYLEKTLKELSKTHGGYFSKDNSDKDEAIEKEVNEILHDKEALLSLENTRRFIFSKWTLKEGWDNPNVFQICKLRSSGSDISKLQEVGRGLRLPVNEYGSRVKDEQFYLNYFVDFTEIDFIDSLVQEINEKSNTLSSNIEYEKVTEEMIKIITEKEKIGETNLLEILDKNGVINRANEFTKNGLSYMKENYPYLFNDLSNKIKNKDASKNKVSVRIEKYSELKDLWEKINEKVILEYKFKNEKEVENLLTKFFDKPNANSYIENIKTSKKELKIENDTASYTKEDNLNFKEYKYINTMKYSDFLKQLSKEININLKTIHNAIVNSNIEINKFLNYPSIKDLKTNFNNFLMYNAISDFGIEYKKISNNIHPTKLTDKNGNPLKEINTGDIGIKYENKKVSEKYLFDEMFYDSELEKKDISNNIEEVIVFTKIPKNSIKIPISGGKSYSPDFAYVINYKNKKKKMHFIIEAKDINGDDVLRKEEEQKIKHAEKFFKNSEIDVDIKFETQFKSDTIKDLIEKTLNNKI